MKTRFHIEHSGFFTGVIGFIFVGTDRGKIQFAGFRDKCDRIRNCSYWIIGVAHNHSFVAKNEAAVWMIIWLRYKDIKKKIDMGILDENELEIQLLSSELYELKVFLGEIKDETYTIRQ